MKKCVYLISLSLLFVTVSLSSCSSGCDIPVVESEKSLDLTTAIGTQLASNVGDIKRSISMRLAEEYGRDIDLTITDIEHISISQYCFAAIIHYETSDGEKGSEIRTNAILDKYNRFIDPNLIKTRMEFFPHPGKTYTVSCSLKANKECKGGCGSGSISHNASTNIWSASCNCEENCTLTLTES